ncbi:MAG: sensor histidine kinase, partial [Balneolaceae bacterium]
AEKMIGLVNNLLDIQNKSALTANEELNIVEILKHSVENFEKSANRKNIDLKCAIEDDPILVYGHSNNLVRIFDNLISNSLKYSPFNTTVNISVETNSEHVRVTFKDEGPGISKDEQRNLFRQYGTTSNRPTGNEGSVGLGLYIVKKFTNAMNGDVWCISEPGEGSEFIFELPLVEKTNSASEPETEVSCLQ